MLPQMCCKACCGSMEAHGASGKACADLLPPCGGLPKQVDSSLGSGGGIMGKGWFRARSGRDSSHGYYHILSPLSSLKAQLGVAWIYTISITGVDPSAGVLPRATG